jgi:hypothetical protein
MAIDYQHITLVDLRGGQQPRDWVDHIPLNRSFQVARSIPLVGSFLQQELPAFLGDSK